MGHPYLRAGQPQLAGKARQGAVISGITNARLVPQNFVGQIVAFDLRQRHCRANIGFVTQFLPIVLGQIGCGILPRQVLAALFKGYHAVQRFIELGCRLQMPFSLCRFATSDQGTACPEMCR